MVRRHGHRISGQRAVQRLYLSTLVLDCPICATNSSPGARRWGRGVSASWLCTLPATLDQSSPYQKGLERATFPEPGDILRIQSFGIDSPNRTLNLRTVFYDPLGEQQRHSWRHFNVAGLDNSSFKGRRAYLERGLRQITLRPANPHPVNISPDSTGEG